MHKKTVRQKFVIKVYTIVAAMMGVTYAMVLLFTFYKPLNDYMSKNPHITFIFLAIGAFFLIALLCKVDFFKKYPINWLLLGSFTLAWSLFVASWTVNYNWKIVLIALTMTLGMTIGLSLIAFCLMDDMYWCFGVVATLAFSVVPMILFVVKWPDLWFSGLLSFIGTILASIYIIIDTKNILERYDPSQYIIGSLFIYTDIITLFLYILSLFGATGGK